MSTAELSPQTAGISDYQRLVVLRNPVSTNAAEWEKYIDDVKENTSYTSLEIIESEKAPADTADKLANNLRDGDIVYILGGDGLANDAAQFLSSIDAPRTATMFSPLGNACNAYHATILDRNYDGQPSKILQRGAVRSTFPLRAEVEGDETYSQLALSIISVGAIATGAAVLDQPEHRSSPLRRNPRTRLAYEFYLSLCKTPLKLRTLELADYEGGNERLALDVLAANAPELAKVARFDTQITEHEFLLGTIKDKQPWNLITGMVRLMRGTMPMERISQGEKTVSFRLTQSKRNREAMIEYDGEVKKLAPESRVTIDQVGYNDPRHRPIPTITAS